MSWRSEARPGDAIGDQIWLKFLTWNAATAMLTTTEQESPIPRPWTENLGDQRRPQLAAVGLPPSGALAIAWDDYSQSQGVDAGNPDVVVRYAPSRAGAPTSHSCTPVTVTSDATAYHNVYTAVPGATVKWTANATCSIAPQYQFSFLGPGGVWTTVQEWSTTSSYTWNTTALAPGVWYMQVWVRDIGYTGSPAYQAYTGRTSELIATAACTGAFTVASPPLRATVGSQVTFTTTPSGCPLTEYRIVHRYPDGTWVEEKPYASANASWTWDTSQGGAANAPGVHSIQVWVRAPGSVVSYQAYSSLSYTLTSP